MKNETVAEYLGRKGEELRFESIPKEVISSSKKFILDILACILGAKEVTSSQVITDVAIEMGGNAHSTIIGHGVKTSPVMAALANATMGHAFDMDDDHREGTQHPTVVVFPALLALAEKYGVGGKQFLTSFIFGSEVTIRLGEAFLGHGYNRGFHPTGTCGVFGAAAGAAKILNFEQDKIIRSLGVAGSQAAGLLEWNVHGSWTKRLQAGHASMCGVISSLLASKNFTAPPSIIEGRFGFLKSYAYNDIFDIKKIVDDFGSRWEMNDTSIKVHSCSRFASPLADCAVELYAKGVNPDEIKEIIAKASDIIIKGLTEPSDRKYKPQTIVDAQFSLPYTVAVALCKGRASVLEFTDEAIKDKRVLGVAAKVKWEIDPEANAIWPSHYPASVVVKTKNGKEVTSVVKYPKGDPENPVSYEEVEEKFRFLAGFTIGKNKIDKVIQYMKHFEELDNLNALITCLY